MAVLSTLRELSLPYNCYEVGHTWCPSCTQAALDVGLHCVKESIQIYGSLYGLSQVFQRKFSPTAFLKTLQSIVISTSFLSFNVFGFIFIFCLLRKLTGKFYYLHCSYLPGFLSSFLAIMIERKNRQTPLAMYVTNVASETLFKMLISRGVIKPFRYGEVLIFCTAMSMILYTIRKNGYSNDIVNSIIKQILGQEEAKCLLKKKEIYRDFNDNGPEYQANKESVGCNHTRLKPLQEENNISKNLKHPSCPHREDCLLYIVKGFVCPFVIGYGLQIALKIISSPRFFLMHPLSIFKLLSSSKIINPVLFLGSFSGLYKLASCMLRWIQGANKQWHAIPAGFLAGCSMIIYPSPSLALYLIWKVVEMAYRYGMTKGILPQIPGGILLLYATSTALLLYASFLEPHNLKPAYLKFLNRISGNRLQMINRQVLDIFGTHASKLYSDFFPKVDPKYTSRAFQETVLVWLIR